MFEGTCADRVEPVEFEVIELGVVGEQKVAAFANPHSDGLVKRDDVRVVVGCRGREEQ